MAFSLSKKQLFLQLYAGFLRTKIKVGEMSFFLLAVKITTFYVRWRAIGWSFFKLKVVRELQVKEKKDGSCVRCFFYFSNRANQLVKRVGIKGKKKKRE
jgi:hypothetical protein